jgi:hypothetical protein
VSGGRQVKCVGRKDEPDECGAADGEECTLKIMSEVWMTTLACLVDLLRPYQAEAVASFLNTVNDDDDTEDDDDGNEEIERQTS